MLDQEIGQLAKLPQRAPGALTQRRHRGLHDLPSTVVELANYFETTTVYMNSRLKYMTTENILGYDAVPYAGRGGVTRHYKISDAISQVVIDRRVATPT